MKKFRLYLDTEAEVKWLNEMSDQGWKLTGFCLGFYTFEECEKGKYVYQEDTTETFFTVSNEYRGFMNDAGIEIAAVWGPWVILCQEKEKGEFELYSDYESKIEHQKKILKIFKVCTIIELICFFIEIWCVNKGAVAPIYFAIFIGLILFSFCRMVFKTKARINKLRALNGEIAINEKGTETNQENGKAKVIYSPVLIIGNALYLFTLFMGHGGSEIKETIYMILLILACIFMVAGVYLTWHGTKES